MRILALDLGEKRIGVAVSDPTGTLASSLDLLPRRNRNTDMAAIAELAAREGAEKVVVGLPISLSGELGPQALLTRRFIEELAAVLPLPIEEWDERFTTVTALEALRAQGVSRKRRRQRVDSAAAAVLLQDYLDSHPARQRTAAP